MKLPKPGADFEPCPEGTHAAVCTSLIDLGTQTLKTKGGPKPLHQIFIGWELPDERREDNEPHFIGNRYNFSMDKRATLRKHLESWRGVAFRDEDFETFDMRNLLMAVCQVSVVHTRRDDKVYSDVTAVTRLVKGAPIPETSTKPTYFSMQEDEFDLNALDAVGDTLKKAIMQSPEYQHLMNRPQTTHGNPLTEGYDDPEIPF